MRIYPVPSVLMMRLLAALTILLACTGGVRAACRAEPRTTVPLEVINGNVLVMAAVNDVNTTFILDTGADRTMVSEDAVHRLGLQRDSWVASMVLGIGGLSERPNALPRSLQLGGVALRRRTLTGDTSMTVGRVPVTEIAGRPVAGLLGRDFLSPFDLDFDLPAGKLTLYDVDGCAGRFLPWTMPYASIPATTPVSNALVVQTVLDGRVLRAMVDSGASSSLITAPGMYRLGLTQEALAHDAGGNGSGAGPQPVPMWLHHFTELRVGPDSIRDPSLWVAPVHIVPIVDMLLGADWLRTRHVWLSFATKQVFVAAH